MLNRTIQLNIRVTQEEKQRFEHNPTTQQHKRIGPDRPVLFH